MIDRYRNYRPQPVSQRRKPPAPRRHHPLFTLLCAGLVLYGLFYGKGILSKQRVAPAAPAAAKVKKVTINAEPIPSTTWNELQQAVTAQINQYGDLDISMTVIDVITNTKASYGIQNNFAGASTTKVLTAAAYFNMIESGQRSLNQKLNGQPASYHLKQMINQSNNESWSALNKSVSLAKLEAYAHSLGMKSFVSSKNTITATDEALLLQQLYSNQLLNTEHTKLLLSYMQNTNNEAMIPKVVPDGAILYHKYGQLEDRLHDAAIIDYQDRPLVIVIYTKGGSPTGSEYSIRVTQIQQLASLVFSTFYAQQPS